MLPIQAPSLRPSGSPVDSPARRPGHHRRPYPVRHGLVPRHADRLLRLGVVRNVERWVRRALRAGASATRSVRSWNDLPGPENGKRNPLLCVALQHPARCPVGPVVRLLLDHGASVNTVDRYGSPAFWWCTFRRHWGAAQVMLDRGAPLMQDLVSPHHPWLCVTEAGQVELARTMLARGFDVNRRVFRHQTALLRLSWPSRDENGQRSVPLDTKVRLLDLMAEHGVTVDLAPTDPAPTRPDRFVPRPPIVQVVSAAPSEFELEVFEWFVGQGVDLQVRLPHPDHRFTALRRRGRRDLPEDDLNETGWGLLHLAARAGNVGLLARLIELGLDPGERTSRGRTALDVAHFYHHPDAVVVLEHHALQAALPTGIGREAGNAGAARPRARL